MTPTLLNSPASRVRTAVIAATAVLATAPAAFAGGIHAGVQTFLAQPSNFVVLAEGAPGTVTFASMMGDTLAIQYSVPTHAGDTFGEIVGTVNKHGVFVGNSVQITQDGQGRAAPVSMSFDQTGALLASGNSAQSTNFVPAALYDIK